MRWWVQNIDAILSIAFGVVASLMGIGVIRISKKTADPMVGRARKIRIILRVLGPLLVVFGVVQLTFAPQSTKGWLEVKGDGKFSIMLPAPPELKERNAESPFGIVTVHSYSAVAEPNGTDYRIRYLDLPFPNSFDNVAKPFQPDLSSFKGFQETRRSPVMVSGYSAEMVEGTFPGGMCLKVEVVCVGPRQYMIMRTATTPSAVSDDRFFSSFRVIAK